jgi:hypothetical protein
MTLLFLKAAPCQGIAAREREPGFFGFKDLPRPIEIWETLLS